MVRQNLETQFNGILDLGFISLGATLVSGFLLLTPGKVVGYLGMGASLGGYAAASFTKRKLTAHGTTLITGLENEKTKEITSRDDEILRLKSEKTKEITSREDEILRLKSDHTSLKARMDKVVELGKDALELQTYLNKTKKECTEQANEIIELNKKLGEFADKEGADLSVAKQVACAAIAERKEGLFTAITALEKGKKYRVPIQKEYRLSTEKGNLVRGDVAEIESRYFQEIDQASDTERVCELMNWAIDELANAKVRMVRSHQSLRITDLLERIVELEKEQADMIPKSHVEKLQGDFEARVREFHQQNQQGLESAWNLVTEFEQQLPEDEVFFSSLHARIAELENQNDLMNARLVEAHQIRLFDDIGWKSEVANKVLHHFQLNEIVCDACPLPIREVGSDLEFYLTPRTRIGMNLIKADIDKVAESIKIPLGVAYVKVSLDGKNIKLRVPFEDREAKKIAPEDVLNRPVSVWGNYLGSEYHRLIFAATQSGKTVLADELNGLQYSQLNGEIEYNAITLKNDGNRDEEKTQRFVSPNFKTSEDYMNSLSDIHEAIRQRNQILQSNPNHRFPRQVFQLDEYGEYYRLGNSDQKTAGKEAVISLLQSGAGLSSETGKGISLTLIAQNPYVSQLGLYRPDLANACIIVVGERNIRMFLGSDNANHGLDEDDLCRLIGELKLFKEASRIASDKALKEAEKTGENAGLAVRKVPENYYSLIIPSKGGLPPVIVYNPKPGEFTNGLIEGIKQEVKPTCPDCKTVSNRQRGQSNRHFCDNEACKRKTFTWKGLA